MAFINGKNVKIPEIDFGFVAFLEDNGTPVFGDNSLRKKTLRFAGNCVAYALKVDPEDAYNLLNQHVLGGGTFNKLYDEIGEAIQSSGFLKKLAENQEKKAPKSATASEE